MYHRILPSPHSGVSSWQGHTRSLRPSFVGLDHLTLVTVPSPATLLCVPSLQPLHRQRRLDGLLWLTSHTVFANSKLSRSNISATNTMVNGKDKIYTRHVQCCNLVKLKCKKGCNTDQVMIIRLARKISNTYDTDDILCLMMTRWDKTENYECAD